MLTVEEIRKRIISVLQENNVRGAVLFGSYAKGTAVSLLRAPCEIESIKSNYFHENCRKMICFILDNFLILLYKEV